MAEDIRALLCTAFETYLDMRIRSALEPSEPHLSYEFDEVDNFSWQLLGGMLVKDELQELINLMDHWQHSLRKWHAWNDVAASYEAEEAWELANEFVEALAHYCLVQPSAMRDAFTFVVTNAMHQVRLCVDRDYQDQMEGDAKAPGEPRYPSRRKKEKRLAQVIRFWPESAEFLSSLRALNDEEYQRTTNHYRNLVNHAIAPRLGVGITSTVTRSVVQPTTMVEQEDGTFLPVPVSGKLAVSYSFGGTGPLELEGSWKANLEQYRRARLCYAQYRTLLTAALA